MYKLTIIYPSASDPEKFKSYYVDKHLPLVRQMPGVKRFNYSFDLASLSDDEAPFCLFEAWFEDGEAMGAASGSPEGQAVVADVPNFADGPPIIFHGPVTEA